MHQKIYENNFYIHQLHDNIAYELESGSDRHKIIFLKKFNIIFCNFQKIQQIVPERNTVIHTEHNIIDMVNTADVKPKRMHTGQSKFGGKQN